jgi:hypothetical protein
MALLTTSLCNIVTCPELQHCEALPKEETSCGITKSEVLSALRLGDTIARFSFWAELDVAQTGGFENGTQTLIDKSSLFS